MLGERCYIYHEEQFLDYFPSLPFWSLEKYKELPHGPEKSYNMLKQIYDLGFEFCSTKDYLTCVDGWCECKSQYHRLLRVGGECRLEENAFCGQNNNILFDKEYPIPKCKDGTSCVKSLYGIHICVKDTSD